MSTIAEVFGSMEYGPAPESAKPALDWIDEHSGRFGHFIGGEWLPSVDGATFETINPATGKSLAAIAQGGDAEVDAAVNSARSAQPEWWMIGGHARARYLYALARQVQKHARLFAVLETLDNGKPIRETRDIDIPLVIRHFYHHAGWAQLMESEFVDCEPIGVAAQIIPWNFPLLMLAWKVAPALAMGNTVVLKPAEYTPLTSLLFAELCSRIGLPPGVLNIVTGDGATGASLVRHPGTDKIAFTGSTEVGRAIRRETAGSNKRLTLELGGKSPFIVFDDADFDGAVEGLVDAIWFNQGQVCCAGSRLLVQERIAETFYAKVRTRMERLRVGDPLDKCTDIGAIIAPVQLERIERLVCEAQDDGATVWQPPCECPSEGIFFPPTLITQVSPASAAAQVEIFGPVLVSMTFRTPQEAVALANNTRYGLAASVWTENINTALDIAPKIKAGTVWINSTNLFDAASGFGGYRESGFGREGGREGLWEYVKSNRRSNPRSTGADPLAIDTRVEPDALVQTPVVTSAIPPLDRTAKLYVGGKQVRPDSGYSRPVYAPDGALLGEVGDGTRKDIRNAVEAARSAAEKWGRSPGHTRAQILYFLAENLECRAAEFTHRISTVTGDAHAARAEVSASIDTIFQWAALADKNDGTVHHTAQRSVTFAMPEPMGVIGIICPDGGGLLDMLSMAVPAVALGNAVVVVPGEVNPLAATDFYQVLETSDMPVGVWNIITGGSKPLSEALALHDDVQAVWHAGVAEIYAAVERASAGNLKRVWNGHAMGDTRELIRQSTQIKNIWLPYTDEVPF